MTELDDIFEKAYQLQEDAAITSKAYVTLFRTELFVPTHKVDPVTNEALPEKMIHAKDLDLVTGQDVQPLPLFIEHENSYFMLAFDTIPRLHTWAGEHIHDINVMCITGRELIMSLLDNVHLCVNFQTEYYKEFPPEEIKQMKKMIERIKQMGEIAKPAASETNA